MFLRGIVSRGGNLFLRLVKTSAVPILKKIFIVRRDKRLITIMINKIIPDVD